jgi:hypothetical protein
MKNGLSIFLLLILSELNAFSQTFTRQIEAQLNENNLQSAVFTLAEIKDSVEVLNLSSKTTIVSENSILPVSKNDLPTELNWNFSWGISAGKTIVYVNFTPFFLNGNGEIEKITEIQVDISASTAQKSKKNNYRAASTSVLASEKWFKYAIIKEGIYKIDYASMLKNGIAVNEIASLNNIKIHSFGGEMLPYSNAVQNNDDLAEISIKRIDNGDGVFNDGDYLLFYADDAVKWTYDKTNELFKHQLNIFSDTVFYFLTYNIDAPKEIVNQNLSNSATVVSYTFLDRQFHELEEKNLLRSGILWLGDHFPETQTFEFYHEFPNIDQSSNAILNSVVYAGNSSPGGSSFDIHLDNGSNSNVYIPSITGSNADDVAKAGNNIYQISPITDSIKISYTYNAPSSAAEGWIDRFDINATRKLIYKDSILFFRDTKNIGTNKVVKFNISECSNQLMLWEIENYKSIKEITYSMAVDTIQFNSNNDTLREYILFNPNKVMSANFYGKIKNQNLHALPTPNLLIITNSNLQEEAVRLGNFHQIHDSLSVQVVLINEVLNEFAGGNKDFCGIRNFIRMLYQNSGGGDTLKYVLLLGDGTFDYKNINPANNNIIPTFQSVNSTKETASYTSDDFYSLLDNNEGGWTVSGTELPDVAVGRIPVTTKEDAKNVVNKILSYSNYFDGQNTQMELDRANLFSNWKNEIMFIADDEDYNIHMKQANQLATKVETEHPNYNVDKVFLDSYKQTTALSEQSYKDAKKNILDKINEGVFLVNYTGHGGEEGFSGEKIVVSSDLRGLNNGIRMPLLFTATCDFSRFDMVDATSAGEEFLLNPNGGAIALFSTTRIVYSSPNFNLNNNFYNIVFDRKENDATRIGDIFIDTKILNNGGLNDRNFTLLGDPAIKLALPTAKLKTVVSSVTDLTSNISTDTLTALMKVQIQGEIQDTFGNKQNDFNGHIFTKVFDKKIPYTTLLNDGGNVPLNYYMQHNSLFEGKSTVNNGSFKIEFLIPKDIAYQVDFGKLSLYAASNTYRESVGRKVILIGGVNNKAAVDLTGPELKLFLNDSSFIFGDATDASPLLLVNVKDTSGINMTSENIGHSMTAVLDDQSIQTIYLNNHFEGNVNSYQEGNIKYRLSDLSVGRHSIEVKAHDSYNNSSRAYTEFIVAGDARVALSHILNYPNPFTTNTGFYFEHNQPGKTIEISIQIFTVSGKLVKTIHENMYAENVRVGPIAWDGMDDYGDAIGKGVYIYQVQVKGEDGSSAYHYEKLVVLK